MTDQSEPRTASEVTAIFLAALVVAHTDLARTVQAILGHDELDDELRATLRRDVAVSMEVFAGHLEHIRPGASDEVMKRYLKPVDGEPRD